jgi:anti-sigma factor RsiW
MSDSMSQYCPNCEAQAAEIERLREIVAIMHTAFAAYADSPAKQEAINLPALEPRT